MVICLERCADLHVAQLMPLPLTISCFSKIQIGFTFLVPAHPGSPGQGAVKWVCVLLTSVVCLCVCLFVDDCEPCKNGWIGWGAIWGVHWWGWRNHVLDGGMNPPLGWGTFEQTYLDMPGGLYTQTDTQGGSTWRCGLHATVTMATCWLWCHISTPSLSILLYSLLMQKLASCDSWSVVIGEGYTWF